MSNGEDHGSNRIDIRVRMHGGCADDYDTSANNEHYPTDNFTNNDHHYYYTSANNDHH